MRTIATLFASLLLAGCADELAPIDAEDYDAARNQDPTGDLDVLLNIAGLQSDLESIVELDLFDVFSESPFPTHPGIAACLDLPVIEDLRWQESGCRGVEGWGWDVRLTQCPIGPNGPVNGYLQYSYDYLAGLTEEATDEELAAAIEEAMLGMGENEILISFDVRVTDPRQRDVQACGQQTGSPEDYRIHIDGQMPFGDETGLEAHFDGRGSRFDTEDHGIVNFREGRIKASFLTPQGTPVPYEMQVFHNVRRQFARYPFTGTLSVRDGPDESVKLRYTATSATIGDVLVSYPDGRSERAFLPRD